MKNGKINLRELMAEARAIHLAMRQGAMTYEEAKIKTRPYLDIVNRESAKIARKYGQRPSKIKFHHLNRGI